MQPFKPDVWSPEEFRGQTLKAASLAADAGAKLRSGEYGVAQQLALDAMRAFEAILGHVKHVQWLAASFEQTDAQVKLSSPLPCGTPLSQRSQSQSDGPLGRSTAVELEASVSSEDAKTVTDTSTSPAISSRSVGTARKRIGSSDEEDEPPTILSEECVWVSPPSTLDTDRETCEPLICKEVRGYQAGDDAGSGAEKDLAYYEAQEDGWLMLGHGVSERMMIVKNSPWVRKATKYKRCWIDVGSKKQKDYAIYIPSCDDPDYVACGVVFVFKGDNWHKPREEIPVGLVHRSLVEPISLTQDLWSDIGTGSAINVNLRLVPRMRTAWPSSASLLEETPPAFSIRSNMLQLVNANATSVPRHLPVRIRNTFIDFRRPNSRLHERKAQSWPVSPKSADHGDEEEYDLAFMASVAMDLLRHEPGTCSPPLSLQDSASTSTEELPVWDLRMDASIFPSSLWSLKNSWGIRPRDGLYENLELKDIGSLSATCKMLRRWPRRAFFPDTIRCEELDRRGTGESIDRSDTAEQTFTRFSSVDEQELMRMHDEYVQKQTKFFSPEFPQRVYPSFSTVGLHASMECDAAPCVRRRKPSDAIIPFLIHAEICKLQQACKKLKQWFLSEQTFHSQTMSSAQRVGQNDLPHVHSDPSNGAAPQPTLTHPAEDTCEQGEPVKRSRRPRRRKLARELEQAELENALRASAPRAFVHPVAYGGVPEMRWQVGLDPSFFQSDWYSGGYGNFSANVVPSSASVPRGTELSLSSMV